MKLDGFGLFVEDMPTMVRFYRDVLGFAITEGEDAENVYLDTVTAQVINEQAALGAAIDAGTVDEGRCGNAEWIQRLHDRDDIKHYSWANTGGTNILFNNKKVPFTNANVRRAFSLGFDRQECGDLVWGGVRLPAQGMVDPILNVGTMNYRSYAGDVIGAMYEEYTDLKGMLIQGMEELGLGSDPATLDVTIDLLGTDAQNLDLAAYLQESYKEKFGVNLSSQANEWAIYLDKLASFEKQNDADIDVLLIYGENDDPAKVATKVGELINEGKRVLAAKSRPDGIKFSETVEFTEVNE